MRRILGLRLAMLDPRPLPHGVQPRILGVGLRLPDPEQLMLDLENPVPGLQRPVHDPERQPPDLQPPVPGPERRVPALVCTSSAKRIFFCCLAFGGSLAWTPGRKAPRQAGLRCARAR